MKRRRREEEEELLCAIPTSTFNPYCKLYGNLVNFRRCLENIKKVCPFRGALQPCFSNLIEFKHFYKFLN